MNGRGERDMDCREVRDIILDNMESECSRIAEHLENCSRCRKFSEAAELIDNGNKLYTESPDNLEAKCLDKLKHEFIKDNRASGKGKVVKKGITVRMKYLAAAAVLIAVLSVSVTLSVVSFSSENRVVVYLTLYAPDAELVSVVGDWNDWIADADRMQDTDRDGRWEIRLEVIPGREYRYQFLIDGKIRLPDPDSGFTVNDGFGGENSILEI